MDGFAQISIGTLFRNAQQFSLLRLNINYKNRAILHLGVPISALQMFMLQTSVFTVRLANLAVLNSIFMSTGASRFRSW